ncbi:ABC transporter ATP-binding protein [Actibacterium sp. 188UL27-1]|uniref:ABC transporter ATP-binding protein n=1 Tax=Actibacterium sp. 188UL27-1 TaxID=2786961 RepID=UPI0019587ABE|nr:ABC transporter ATP-binding protein [Actibacterium sp. 188UL27-1]MBM7066388.1 ABC transporter ATP-binding protein [Actibacterium sp. 188UL27-1]
MSGLQAQGLNLRIGETPILKDVSLDIAPGQILGLVGESGSGKSMTALAVMQLLPGGSICDGTVSLDGDDLTTLTEAQMCDRRGCDVSMIFQEPMTALNPVQTIGFQIAETVTIHGGSRAEGAARARDLLARVGLAQIPLDRYPHELSGGQRQRVCIALAIALHPKLLIADEPTTALDVTTQAQILDLLKQIVTEEGMAMLFITHDLAVVAGLADEVAVMKDGAVVEHGPTAQLFARMQHPYTRALFAASRHQPQRQIQAAPQPLLTIQNATRTYRLPRPHLFAKPDALEAVSDVSFSLHRGESLGLVGGSGCGKSTLTRAILGLEPLQGGKIQLDGQSISPDMPPDVRGRMQVVFQDPYGSFNPRHRVRRILTEPFHLQGSPTGLEARIAEALTSVGLSPQDADKFPHAFSGGQRQRIAIARALITRPDLIVLDEAVSALDVSVRAQVLDLLADLQGQLKLSYLFISHDLTVVRAITDRVLVMAAGKIVEEGPTERVFADPQHSYTRALLAAAPKLPEAAA